MSELSEVFANINNNLNAEKAAKINSTYLFDVEGQKWFADLTKSEGPWITEGEGEAKCVITVAKVEDWVSIATGKTNPTSAFMTGKLKLKGDMSLAMKLQGLLAG